MSELPTPGSHGTAPGGPRLELHVNGEPQSVPEGCTVQELLQRLGRDGGRIAVAVNRSVVPRSERAEHRLAAGDRVEILEAVGGG